jgi:glucose/mannose transport system permease protein
MSVAAGYSMSAGVEPRGRKPKKVTIGRVGLYAFLIISAVFFLAPLVLMIMTSMKSMTEIRTGNLFAFPTTITFDYWIKAWSTACTGRDCNGLAPGFFNSLKIWWQCSTATR